MTNDRSGFLTRGWTTTAAVLSLGVLALAGCHKKSAPPPYGGTPLATGAAPTATLSADPLSIDLGPDAFRLRGRSRDESVDLSTADPFAVSVRRFLDAVREGDPNRVACPPADALGTLRVAVACERALVSGETVAVADVE